MKYQYYCINLFERQDRYEKMVKNFNENELEVKFIRNSKHPKGGIYGCFDSHIQCVKDAYDKNLDYCIVFEDDNNIYPNCKDNIKIAEEFYKNNPDTEYIILHNRGLYHVYEKLTDDIYECTSMGASCIFLTKSFIKKIINTYASVIEHKIHYDFYLYLLCKKQHLSVKFITYSFSSKSDNENWLSVDNKDILKDIITKFPVLEVIANKIVISENKFLNNAYKGKKTAFYNVIKFLIKKFIYKEFADKIDVIKYIESCK